MRRAVRRPLARDDHLGHQLVGMQAALHQRLGVAGTHQRHRDRRRVVAVLGVDDPDAVQVDAEFLGDAANPGFRTDQDRFDDPFMEGDDRPLERLLVARVGDGGRNRFHAPDQRQHLLKALALVVDADRRAMKFLHVRDLLARGENLGGAAQDLQVFLIGGDAIENHMLVVIEFLLGRQGDGNRVADRHRPREMQALVDQDRAGAGKLGAEHGGNQRAAPHAMRHDFAEHAAFRIPRVGGGRIEVSGQYREKLDVLGHQRARKAREIADMDFVVGLVDDMTLFGRLIHWRTPWLPSSVPHSIVCCSATKQCGSCTWWRCGPVATAFAAGFSGTRISVAG